MKKLTLLILSIFTFGVALAENPKPFVIPELRQWVGQDGNFIVKGNTAIVVDESQSKELMPIAEALASDILEMFSLKLKVKVGKATPGSIFFHLASLPKDNSEAYTINTTSNGITITANQKVGAFWATRTLLQIMEQSTERAIPCGQTLDWPVYEMRGFMLDCGRKYFKIDFLRQYVKFMAYYKMNSFQVHLNDNSFKQFFNNDWDQTQAAFRLESTTYPGLASTEGHYTKQEFIDLQILAENNFVNIIPEIDAPAHTLAFSRYMPEIGSKEYGADHLDLFNPKTYEFMDGLYKEYLEGESPVFRGKTVHIGTDEYSNRDQKVVEQFRHFTDYYIKKVESYGKKVAMWGALTHAKGTTPVKVDDVLMACWYNGYAKPDSMIKLGYDVYAIPDGSLYIVPMAGYYYDYLNTKHLYEKWTPANIGNQTFPEGNPKVKGGMFAVWNDHAGNGISSRDVHDRVWPAMQTLSVKMWDGTHATLPYDEFNTKRELLSEAPGVNLRGHARQGVILTAKTLKSGQKLALNEVGYGYRVSFNVNCPSTPTQGTVLLQNSDAKFYLADPTFGKLGFSRDGYTFTFDYKLPVGQTVKIAVEGTNRLTKLFVNDELVQTLDVTYRTVGYVKSNAKMALIKTLQFPLAETGTFKAKVTDLVVYKQ